MLPKAFRHDLSIPCWDWNGTIDPDTGRGRLQRDGKQLFASRFVYVQLGGVIPEGYTIDHLCMNKRCVNPAHLEPVTAGVNHRRWVESVTECRNGHAFTVENTRVRRTDGSRMCRACEAIRNKKDRTERKTKDARSTDVG